MKIIHLVLAAVTLTLILSIPAWAEEPLIIPEKARQNFEHTLKSFLAERNDVQKQLKDFNKEEAKQFKLFTEAGSEEEREAAGQNMDGAMLAKISRLADAFASYNDKIKELRGSLHAMADASRTQKAETTITSDQFNTAMVSFEPIAKQLARLGLSNQASELQALSFQIANKHRIEMANRARIKAHFTTGYISGLSESLYQVEAKLVVLTGTLKQMVLGIEEAHTARDVGRMKAEVTQIKDLGAGLSDVYLNQYGQVLDYMMGAGQSPSQDEQVINAGAGMHFPRLGNASK